MENLDIINRFYEDIDQWGKSCFSRYRQLSKSIWRVSLTRALQYEILKYFKFNGDVLDFGGGEKADYRPWLNCSRYLSVNIDSTMRPTWLIKTGGPLPCESNSIDAIISLNTLEHVYNPYFVLREMHRVLKDSGELIISTPFLYPIHGHPDDFFRPTPSWYRKSLRDAGFKKIKLIPLSYGPFSTGLTCSGIPGPGKVLRKQIALFLDWIYMRIRIAKNKSVSNLHMQQFATAFLSFSEK